MPEKQVLIAVHYYLLRYNRLIIATSFPPLVMVSRNMRSKKALFAEG